MRKTILIVNFLALCTLSLAANFVFSPVDTHAQSSQAAEQQADRGGSQLAPQTSDIRAGRGTYFAVVRHLGVIQAEAAAELGFDPRQVNVYTANQTFQSFDMGFHLIVNCS